MLIVIGVVDREPALFVSKLITNGTDFLEFLAKTSYKRLGRRKKGTVRL